MNSSNPTAAPARHSEPGFFHQLRKLLLSKLWLPRFVYEALPYVYMAIGVLALYAATALPEWTWILPYAVLLGLICLHAGLGIATLRYRFRKKHRTNKKP